MKQVSQLLRESIRYSLDNREDALQYAMQFARDMDIELADRFVAMWVTTSRLITLNADAKPWHAY